MMKTFTKNAAFSLILIAIGFGIGYMVLKKSQSKIIESRSVVLMDKIETVLKLVTVEGAFNESYDESNIKQLVAYFPFPHTFNFTKKAKLSVTGKVLVGYDMKEVEISLDSLNKIIVLSNLPEPKVLAIDHDISYEHLKESWMNSFKPEDFTRLNKNARMVIENHVNETGLLDEAVKQGNSIIDIIKYMAESAGWTVVVKKAKENLSLQD